MHVADLRTQGGLISCFRGSSAKERGYFRAGLYEAKDVIYEEKYFPARILEVLGKRDPREYDVEPRSRRLVHLAERHHDLVENAHLFEFIVQLIAFTDTLAYPGENTSALVFFDDIVNQFHDQDGLPATGPADNSRLASPGNRKEEIHSLDSCLNNIRFGRFESRDINGHF